jgi:hypothetical protein
MCVFSFETFDILLFLMLVKCIFVSWICMSEIRRENLVNREGEKLQDMYVLILDIFSMCCVVLGETFDSETQIL